MHKKALLILYVLLFYPDLLKGQHSIFERDTVYFTHYILDESGKIKKQISFPEANTFDSITDHSIYIDSERRVHWNATELGKSNEGLALPLWNMGIHEEGESVQDLAKSTPPNRKTFLPLFRTFKKNNTIYYETIEAKPKILFRISISRHDTMKELPFFMNEGTGQFLKIDGLELVYDKDTVFDYRTASIDCYRFKSQVIKTWEGMKVFTMYYHEILFEKTSLLPVAFIERRCYRNYEKPWSKVKNDTSEFRLNYLSSFLLLKE